MGHICWICGRQRPNEAFSGKGHKTHVCKECRRLPAAQREKSQIEEDLYGFVRQSRISEKNMARLEVWAAHDDTEIREVAVVLLQVAEIAPGKRKRWKRVREANPELFERCLRLYLVSDEDLENLGLDLDWDSPPGSVDPAGKS
jgi:hypothetical protein